LLDIKKISLLGTIISEFRAIFANSCIFGNSFTSDVDLQAEASGECVNISSYCRLKLVREDLSLKVVFHERYKEVYSDDPASSPGRIESILNELDDLYPIVEPVQATDRDVLLVHTGTHLSYVKGLGRVYDIALLAIGGTIEAAELAARGESTFALIRPPGHHASSDSCWGFCYFNNVAVAVKKLQEEGRIATAVVLDLDLHFGDGTSNIFSGRRDVHYYHAPREETLNSIKSYLSQIGKRDIIAVSARFDRHVSDWGGMLETEDYARIGDIVRKYADEQAEGRCFAALEERHVTVA
jgi:acetoin utilization deacetylase AcuC-like enzyme